MKILGIVGSMRRKGNTNFLVREVLKSAKTINPQIETEILQISELKIESCRACYELCSKEPYKCIIEDDLEKVFKVMKSADGIVIGSPLYFGVPSRLTALLERLVCLSYFYEMRGFSKPHPLTDKPCGLIAVTGGDSPMPVLERLLNFVLAMRMRPIMLKAYPYLGVDGIGNVKEDEDLKPIENAKILGQLLLKHIEEKL